MFEHLKNQWTPLLPISDLKTNPQAAELAGEKLVLFRDTQDEWHALRDYCPHRGAALSKGVVTAEGHLRCGYHGWRYDGSGACVGVPLNDLNTKALGKIRVHKLPARQIGGALWVYTQTDSDVSVPEPQLSESLTGDPRLFVTYQQEWQAHWTRAQENFIDFAHPPYLHESTIGGWMHGFAERGGIAHVDTEDTAFGMAMTTYLGSGDPGFQLHWYRPNLSILFFGPTPYNWLHVFCIPINNHHTRVMTVRRVRSIEDLESYSKHASGTDNRILDEDREIVETQRGDVLSDRHEISVATDKPTLVFRDWYAAMLANTGVQA